MVGNFLTHKITRKSLPPGRSAPYTSHMSHDDAIIFGNLVGKLNVLVVECTTSRSDRYASRRLIERRGRDGKLIEWFIDMTADCPRQRAQNYSDAARDGPTFPRCSRGAWSHETSEH